MAIRSKVISTLSQVFEKYGYSQIQTPSLEYAEVLRGKYGPEAEKLMYIFTDHGNREVGLNYDLTVPTARLVSQYPDLPKPFKRYQIQPSFRAENTQKGRYRQFVQCDIDCIGSKQGIADAEILAIISESLTALKLNNFTIRVNSRQILFDLIIKSGISSDKSLGILQSIDKLDKKSEEEIKSELSEKRLTKTQIDELIYELKSIAPDAELLEIINTAKQLGATNIKFDPTMVRGLDYYTGAIFETVVSEPKIGSVTGGGRYDHLIESLGGPDLPAVGTTIGLDRICDCIEELNLWPNFPETPTKILVTTFSPQEVSSSLSLAKKLRSDNVQTELFSDSNTKLDKQLKYAASRKIPFVAIIGQEESDKNQIKLKNMETGKQISCSYEDLLKVLLSTKTL